MLFLSQGEWVPTPIKHLGMEERERTREKEKEQEGVLFIEAAQHLQLRRLGGFSAGSQGQGQADQDPGRQFPHEQGQIRHRQE